MFTLLYVLINPPVFTAIDFAGVIILGMVAAVEIGLIEFPLWYYFFIVRKTNKKESVATISKVRRQEKLISRIKR